MPWTMGMFLFAGLSIAGMPPLNGFASKWMIFQACLQSGHYLLGLAALMGSLFTLAAILKFAHAAFMGQPSEASAKMTEAPASMLVAMGILVAASVAIGFVPGLLLVPIAGIQQALGLDAVTASLTGPLPGIGRLVERPGGDPPGGRRRPGLVLHPHRRQQGTAKPCPSVRQRRFRSAAGAGQHGQPV